MPRATTTALSVSGPSHELLDLTCSGGGPSGQPVPVEVLAESSASGLPGAAEIDDVLAAAGTAFAGPPPVSAGSGTSAGAGVPDWASVAGSLPVPGPVASRSESVATASAEPGSA